MVFHGLYIDARACVNRYNNEEAVRYSSQPILNFKWIASPASWHGAGRGGPSPGGPGDSTDDQAKGDFSQHLKSKEFALLGFRFSRDW